MLRLVERERLLTKMRQRHRLAVIALEAPAGFGRTVLIDQSMAEGPIRASDQDLLYRCGPDDGRLESLTEGLLALCGRPDCTPDRSGDPVRAARSVVAALEATGPAESHIALFVDNVERSGEAGAALWPIILDRLPQHRHLVLSGRRLPSMGLARHIAAGSGLLIGPGDLAFDDDELDTVIEQAGDRTFVDGELATWPALASLVLQDHPELVGAYLTDAVLSEIDPVVVKALAAVASVGGCSAALIAAVIGSVLDPAGPGRAGVRSEMIDDVADRLAELPLVQSRGEGCWPHPMWNDATQPVLTPAERSQVIVAHARGQIGVGAISEAGRLALRTENGDALNAVTRAALSTQPPHASLADLMSWSASELLPSGSVERDWLAAVIELQLGDADGSARLRLEQSRQAFEAAGDVDAETSVMLHLGHIARSRSDLAELTRLLQRGEVLAAEGNLIARGLVALGRAVSAQLSSDPEGAIAALDHIPPGSLVGEWAAQALMIRGTNLLLAGRAPSAIAALDAATGEGSVASRAVAHDLLAAARWYSGDPVGALHDARTAEDLAIQAGTPTFLQLVRAARACLLAATSQRGPASQLLDQLHHGAFGAASDEAEALSRLAEVLLLVDAGDLQEARVLLATTRFATRSVRSTVWKVSLDLALLTKLPDNLAALAEHDVALGRAVAAGRAAAEHVGGGPPADGHHRPYLPARWCAPDGRSIAISLYGSGRIERDFRAVDHAAWGRARVRELCLHLALIDDRDRANVAAALWPDKHDRSAGQNLRVTLAHLLDVLDPDRVKTQGSDLIIDNDGSLTFNRDTGLHIDLWDMRYHAEAILATPDHERPSLLAHARRLVALDSGPLLGGVAVGDWLDPHRRRLDDLVVNAELRGGAHALVAADHGLAHSLGQRALTIDPWSERAHRLVIEALLGEGDVDGARRALHHAVAVLNDLGVAPSPATVELSYRAGLGHPSLTGPIDDQRGVRV
jgi:LuxR family maltose regulon positive regulatory protein